jgi:hypothetical protein
MTRWPSIFYLVYRDSRPLLEKRRLDNEEARQKLVAHCQTCGCLACQVRLAALGEFFFDEDVLGGGVQRKDLKHLVN